MSRTVYLVRHGLSEANNRENIGIPAFSAHDAPLMKLGVEQAREVGDRLSQYVLDKTISVATSTMYRTQQTALAAGFTNCTPYNQLDEITPDLTPEQRRLQHEEWRQGNLPDEVLWHAETTLEFAPPEQVWFTHGLRIAGICYLLDQQQDKTALPQFGEVREITLPDSYAN
ncbi:MAG: phosphoglycerate mutase family protein [Candidatus Saccharimonadales bacterium]